MVLFGKINWYLSICWCCPKNCDVFISCVRTRNEPKKASGGGVVRKAFRCCGFRQSCFPDFEPICSGMIAPGNHCYYKIRCALQHSPGPPSGPDRKPGAGRFHNQPQYLHSDYRKSFDKGRERYIGEGGSKSGQKSRFIEKVPIDFAVSASPMLTSLVTFLFSDKKVTPIVV